MIIKALLIAAIAVIALLLARGHGVRHLAVRRLLLAVFALAATGSIIVPDAWSRAANLIGVGRGADLLLYLLIVVFLSYVATRFARDRRSAEDMTRIVRRLALDEAPPPRPDGADGNADTSADGGAEVSAGDAPTPPSPRPTAR
jgi:hypothetical protein